MNFKLFFENSNIVNLKMASNPHHRSVSRIMGSTNRKSQNIVADLHKKSNEYISSKVTNAKYTAGRQNITHMDAQRLATQYGFELKNKDYSKPFQLAIKQQDGNGNGKFLCFNPPNKWTIEFKKVEFKKA